MEEFTVRKMTIAVLLFVALIPFKVSAQSELTGQEFCLIFEKQARAVLSARQSGVSLAELLETPIAPETTDPVFLEIFEGLYRKMVLGAFKFPIIEDEKTKQRAIEEFANNVLRSCLGG